MEFLLRLCAVRRYVTYERGEFLISEYTGKYVTWLDQFSEEAMDMDESKINEYRKSLVDSFSPDSD